MIKYFLYFFLIIFGFFYCSDPSSKTDLDPPAPLKMVEKTQESDTTLYETGIDAIPEDDAISLAWHPYEGINRINTFRIYRSTAPVNFDLYAQIDVENNFDQDTTFQDNNVILYTDYYYFVTVIDEDNQESSPSDTVKYLLLEKATPTEPNGILFNPGEIIDFRFLIPGETNANGYIIRIERHLGVNNIELVHIEYVNPRPDFGVSNASREISADVFPALSGSRDYYWRVDIIAGDVRSEGSESHWANFTINWGN